MPGSASFQYVRTYKSRNAINRQGVMTTIDLQDASQSAMPLTLILSVGRDLALLDTRDAMLRACGYIVESELSEKQAINHFRAGDFDLVLLCHSIASQDRDHLAWLIRAFGSRVPIVLISRSPGQDAGFANASIGCEPRKFLDGIRQVLEGKNNASGRGAASHDNSVDTTRDEDRRNAESFCASMTTRMRWRFVAAC
jgi:CheY-like chemotaxis protein